jgi:hypothetical protein
MGAYTCIQIFVFCISKNVFIFTHPIYFTQFRIRFWFSNYFSNFVSQTSSFLVKVGRHPADVDGRRIFFLPVLFETHIPIFS